MREYHSPHVIPQYQSLRTFFHGIETRLGRKRNALVCEAFVLIRGKQKTLGGGGGGFFLVATGSIHLVSRPVFSCG